MGTRAVGGRRPPSAARAMRAAAAPGPRARPATHSGSWYSADGSALLRQVTELMDSAAPAAAPKGGGAAAPAAPTPGHCRAIISPHAGLSYSGTTAAHGFAELRGALRTAARVFVIGPSHHAYLQDMRATPFTSYSTPVGDVEVDTEAVRGLIAGARGTGFPVQYLTPEQDEDEHSIEMQMPFIAAALSARPRGAPRARLVPLVVGHIGADGERGYARLLAPYLADPGNVFVISSDFCHWGPRFGYQYHWRPKEYPAIGDAIVAMDHHAMSLIEQQDVETLDAYFDQTGNTICGRTPISILLHAMRAAPGRFTAPRFVHYSQSQRCRSARDNSVSYASAVVTAA